ncbi:uncharacterized protein N7515_005744 [Penicillium bovifimosum]|uniref:Zn(2)-C6 fungal-type domain-containing protein n=1 Tax=Penicillium bovifimosum TaxID=126998 RepID=A0A9W9GTB2_9EURO|nr:uncharacterized protein N7515_005744 [Penicillium bovifimosum]KAJ5129705.1 hypothetical protein N7515_005744 [Penicillium bovifimosum]
MVGVPHSTGCALCRERRIKCDEAVPECSQCRRYGRACPGYRRTFRFQDEGPNLARRHRSARQKGRDVSAGPSASALPTAPSTAVATDSTTGSSQSEPPAARDDSTAAAAVVRSNAIALMHQHSASGVWDEKLSPSLVRKSLRAAQPQLFLNFISTSFPTLYYHNRFRSGGAPGFAEHIVMSFGQDTYLDSAVCCLGSFYLAYLTNDQALYKASRQMYSQSLREVIRAISKVEHAKSDSMLCTAIILSVFEMYAQTTPDAWVAHSDGAKRLMISRGPEAHESGFGRYCWIAFRGFLIATAVYTGQPCFLDEEGWQALATKVRTEDCQKSGEWSAYGEISDLVFMEIVKCPRYISETRDLLSVAEPDSQAVIALLGRIQDTFSRLRSLVVELRSCITAHSERQQGIVQRPGSFVGPEPESFPDTGPSLLLSGAESMLQTLEQLSSRLQGLFQVTEPSSESHIDIPPSTGGGIGEISSSSSTAVTESLSLPFRIHSELGQGPKRTSDPHDPRAVIWLDRIASSMGVIGAKVLPADNSASV